MLNGSPHAKGNTSIALDEMRKIFEQEGIETEEILVGNKDVRGCIACLKGQHFIHYGGNKKAGNTT